MAYFIYYALLAIWPLLLLPALKLPGWPRAWLCLVACAGLLASVHEFRMVYGTTSAIRLDIPLIAIALTFLYLTAAALLFARGWRWSAAILGLVVALIAGAIAYLWIDATRETKRLSEVFEVRNALVFKAKFRNPDIYNSYFGMTDGAASVFPVGHWEARGGGYFSRLIVNPQGRVWAFFPCGETECDYRSAAPGMQPNGDPPKRQWNLTLKPSTGLPVAVRIAQPDPQHLTIEGRGQPTTFTKSPPPVGPAPIGEPLKYLGRFIQMQCRGNHADVRQLWLWREATRLYAVGIFAPLVHGRMNPIVQPILLGSLDSQDGAWSFAWARNGRSWTATIVLEGSKPTVTLTRKGKAATQVALEPGAIFYDEMIELAPLTGKADWDHWFEMIMVGHFSSGEVPAC